MKKNIFIFALVTLGACQTSQMKRSNGESALNEDKGYSASIAGQCHKTVEDFKSKNSYQENLDSQYAEPVLALLGDDKNPIMRVRETDSSIMESYTADMIICADRNSVPVVIQKFNERRFLQFQPSENDGFKQFQLERFKRICQELAARSESYRWPDGKPRFAAVNVTVDLLNDPHQVGNLISRVNWTLVNERDEKAERERLERANEYSRNNTEYVDRTKTNYDRPTPTTDTYNKPSSSYNRPSSSSSSYKRPSSYGSGSGYGSSSSGSSGYGSSSGSYKKSGGSGY